MNTSTLTRRPLNYLEAIAAQIYTATGGTEYVDYPPHEDSLWLGYAVLCLAKGVETTSQDVHDVWSMWATIYHRGDHQSLVPFDELAPKIQAYDDLYRDAIHQVAGAL